MQYSKLKDILSVMKHDDFDPVRKAMDVLMCLCWLSCNCWIQSTFSTPPPPQKKKEEKKKLAAIANWIE